MIYKLEKTERENGAVGERDFVVAKGEKLREGGEKGAREKARRPIGVNYRAAKIN